MQTNEVKTKAAIKREKNQTCLDSSEREQARPKVKRVHNLIIVDESGSKAMFARERRSRERYNCCLDACMEMPSGSFFKEDEN